jgi:hypothetical protein
MDKHEYFTGTWLILPGTTTHLFGRLRSYLANPDDDFIPVDEKKEVPHRTVLTAFSLELLPHYELYMETVNIPMPAPDGQGIILNTNRLQKCWSSLIMDEQFPIHIPLTSSPKIIFVSQMPDANKNQLKHLLDTWEQQIERQKQMLQARRLQELGLTTAGPADIAGLAKH